MKNYLLLLLNLIFLSPEVFAQAQDSVLIPDQLKKLSLEELMDIEVTSVSKRPEKLAEVASAIQVITRQDIISSGAKTLVEALRLAPNLQAGQVNSSQWAVSARGFNNVLANKLLVLINGRTVYTPLYAGVFWDVQNLLLEDIERIEVISGPGGTLWGANAVNGVINIITKSSADTKGLFVEGAAGNTLPGLGSLRYGGKLSRNLSYRVYGTGFKMGHTVDTSGLSAKDQWRMLQGGARVDWKDDSAQNKIAIMANIYSGNPNPNGDTAALVASGDNVLARWNHVISERSDFQLQLYYDHTWRDFGNGFTEDLKTYDMDWQHRYLLGQRHSLTYGLGFRLMDHQVSNLELFLFLPERKSLYLYSAFLQDEIMLIKERLRITIGSKVEHNSYTGFQYQPNGRLTFTPTRRHTIWSAVSSAVRTPSRVDRDFYLYLAPNFPLLAGSDSFVSEKVLAYELGWRLQPLKRLSVSLSGFYNVYDNLRSAEPGPPPFNIPIKIANGVRGETHGMELAASCQATSWWNLRGGYTLLKKNLWVKEGKQDLNAASVESNDPEYQFLVQSTVSLPGRIELGTVIRVIDKLQKPKVPGYTGIDARIAWKPTSHIELSITGQNLANEYHIEFIPSSPGPRQIGRSVYGKVTCRF